MTTHYKSRFPALWYACIAPGQWSIFDNSDGQMAQVGPIYGSRIELLADLQRFADERGFSSVN